MGWMESVFDYLMERPVTMVALAALPMIPLVVFWRIFPSARQVWLAAVPAAASLGLILRPEWLPGVLGLDGFCLAVCLVDLWTLPHARSLSAARSLVRIASQGKPQGVELSVINHSRRRLKIDIADDVPGEFETEPREYRLVMLPDSRTVVPYRMRALRRGLYRMHCVHVRTGSHFGFWNRQLALPAEDEIHVYPDLKQLREYDLLARTNRLSLLGLRRSRRIGTENEFERLRNYTVDDDHRHIDWRASARRQELTVRDFQANQNQQLLFVVDCGRMMTGLSGRLPLFDHALNAMLMLSWIALSRGDSVGLLLFSAGIQGFVPPQAGTRQINHLLHTSFNQFAACSESRYDLAFRYLDQRVRKRSLVILMTNVMDRVHAAVVEEHLRVQVGRHLPLAVFLRDHELFELAAGRSGDANPPEAALAVGSLESAAVQGVARDVAEWRAEAIARLAKKGILTLDAFPGQLTAPLVNRYLEIKARGLL